MPRDASGNYTLPAGNPVVTGTVIETTWANPTMGDIGTELTNSLDRLGRGGMLAPFKFADGAVGTPSLTFTSEPSLGFFRAAVTDLRAVVGGTARMRWTAAGTDFWSGSAWVPVAGAPDLSGYPTLAGTNNFTGANTFTNNNTDHLTLTRTSTDLGPRIRFANTDGTKGFISIDDAGALSFADSGGVNRFTVSAAGQVTAGDVPWARLSSVPDFASRWPTFAEVTSKPTTLSGFGITDGVTTNTTQTISGLKTFEATSGNTEVVIQKQSSGTQGNLTYKNEAGVDKWRLGTTAATTDDFYIARYNDAGVFQDLPLSVDSVAGYCSFVIGPRVFSTSDRMGDWWRTNASANTGRYVWSTGATGSFFLTAVSDLDVAGQNALQITRSGTNIQGVFLYANGVITLFTQQHATSDHTTGAQVIQSDGVYYDVGMNVMPQLGASSSRALVQTDVGKLVIPTSVITLTTPSSGDTTVPIGGVITIMNASTGNTIIAAGASVSLQHYDGDGAAPATGNRTLARSGVATLVRGGAGTWYIWGVGLT